MMIRERIFSNAGVIKGRFMCDYADKFSGTFEMTKEELEKLNLEHPNFWKVGE